jgi:hypothetical protein
VKLLPLTLEILTVGAPIAVYAAVARRRLGGSAADPRERRLGLLILTFALGAIAFLPAWLLERWALGWAGLDEHARTTTDVAALVYAFFVVAPIEQGLKVLAIGAAWRTRSYASPRDGVLFGSAAALGFVSVHNIELFSGGSGGVADLGRTLLAVPAHLFFAAAWGWALGRDAARGGQKRLGGMVFNVTWLFAMLFNGVYDHIVFARGATALIATAPILTAMLVIALFARRSLQDRDAPRAPRLRFSIAPPSMGDVRAALWRTEQPVMVGWIGIGALVTIGVITAALAAAVAVGHRIGIDFAAVDRGDGSTGAAAPLVLLGAAALGGFPVAGYLVARASAARSVLEAAISSALAIGGGLVLLGLAAPLAVVFAIAFAPVALGLACAGAWMGVRG